MNDVENARRPIAAWRNWTHWAQEAGIKRAEMATACEREIAAWRAFQISTDLAKDARAVGLDTLASFLDMLAMEAKQHTVLDGRPA